MGTLYLIAKDRSEILSEYEEAFRDIVDEVLTLYGQEVQAHKSAKRELKSDYLVSYIPEEDRYFAGNLMKFVFKEYAQQISCTPEQVPCKERWTLALLLGQADQMLDKVVWSASETTESKMT